MILINSLRRLLGTLLALAAVAVGSLNPLHAAESQPEVQADAKDLVFMVEFNIKPEARDAFLTSLGQVVEDMAKEEAFIATYLHQDSKDRNKFVIYERWAETSLEAFMENQLKAKS